MKTMGRAAGAAVLAAILLSAAATSAATAPPADNLNEMMSYDGLVKTKVNDIEMAYILPGASLAKYTSFMLDPVYVSFAKDWKPTTVNGFPIAASDLDSIRTRMAKLVFQEFSKELQRKGGFPLVTAPGPDVLRVKLSIINLVVTAPDTMSPDTASAVASAGQATLFAEFYDSQTGAILARVLDAQAAQNTPGFSVANSVTNMNAAETVIDQWARIMRDRWEKVRKQSASAPAAKAP